MSPQQVSNHTVHLLPLKDDGKKSGGTAKLLMLIKYTYSTIGPFLNTTTTGCHLSSK